MNRSDYSDDTGSPLWRQAVHIATYSKRGQVFLKELLIALDALPRKELITSVLQDESGAVCAVGSVGRLRGLSIEENTECDRYEISQLFDIAPALAAEIMFVNDDWYGHVDPATRYIKMRSWVIAHLTNTGKE